MEYKIEVYLTNVGQAQYLDILGKYFWCILGREGNEDFTNCGFGYADTVEKAFSDAYKYYQKYHIEDKEIENDRENKDDIG